MANPSVIIFGGCGFIGRNLVEYLINNGLVSSIRVVDKMPPQIAWLNRLHQAVFNDHRVEFKSANLIFKDAADSAFKEGNFDYAINCAGETKLGQSHQVYEDGILKVSVNCASAAAKHGVKRYIEISSGQMDSNEKTPHSESDPVKPWSQIANYKLQVESELNKIPDLKYTVIRPAIVYGFGDKTGLLPRLVMGCVYQKLGESMKLLWSKDLIMNTVHVRDLVRAIWHLAGQDNTEHQVYNVVDDNKTTQGMVTEIIAEIFNINCDYFGNLLSTLAKGDISLVVNEANDKHMAPWAEVCKLNGIENTPLSPYIDQEHLEKKHLYLNNQKLKTTGFVFCEPKLTKPLLMEIIQDYTDMKMFPQVTSS